MRRVVANSTGSCPGGIGKRQLADGVTNARDYRQAPKRVPNRDISRLGAQTPLAAATQSQITESRSWLAGDQNMGSPCAAAII